MQVVDLSIRPTSRTRCRVRVGAGVVGKLVEELAALPGRPLVAVISDANVARLHGEPLCAMLRERDVREALLAFPAGEPNKSREVKQDLEDRLFDLGAGRDVTVVALGGGVTGDLAGYVAATWHRGVPLIQVPTTVLAMVDASIGGKTAVNLPGAKNLVGAFHQPGAVYADVALLATLPDEEYVSGFAEVIKAAVIADPAFFRWLEASVAALLDREPAALERAVVRCIELKARVVSRDEREDGRRAILNFGHTVAHAVEAATGYRETHGRAVAAGMCVEAHLACAATGFPQAHRKRLEQLVAAFGLPRDVPPDVGADELVAATYQDKKARAGQARYALPRRLGRMLPGGDVTRAIHEDRLREALAAAGVVRT